VLPAGPLLDERLPIYFNDVLLAHRLAQQGTPLWMIPDATVMHELGGSTRLLGLEGGYLARHHLASLVRYAGLTQPRHRVLLLKLLVLTEAAARQLVRRSNALPWADLTAAVRGDPGPLPELLARGRS
jgi:GT2 family glycosyltransferase